MTERILGAALMCVEHSFLNLNEAAKAFETRFQALNPRPDPNQARWPVDRKMFSAHQSLGADPKSDDLQHLASLSDLRSRGSMTRFAFSRPNSIEQRP